MKDRTILVSAVIACLFHALILFANLGMSPPILASAAASIEVDLVAAPAAPAPQPALASAPEPLELPIEPELDPVIVPIPEPEPEPVAVVEIPIESAVAEPPSETVNKPSDTADTMGDVPEEQTQTYIDDAGEAGALIENVVPTFDRAAAYTYNPKPRYPRAARRRGQEGTVMLLVEVLASGRVGEIEIEKSSGHDLLDNAAAEAVRRWRFVPAEKAGVSVGTQVKIPVEFDLEGEK
jgi:protein TonB